MHQPIDWHEWDEEAFAIARRENKPILLDIGAVWCHWCHVMDEKTYGDSSVRAEIAEHYVPLRIDQDLRPDLSNRYKDYGWPATVIFAADGTEIAKRLRLVLGRGHRGPSVLVEQSGPTKGTCAADNGRQRAPRRA